MKETEKLLDEQYRWKAEKYKHKDKILELRRNANKKFRGTHYKWFKLLDRIGIIIILFNMTALLITSLLVIKQTPTSIISEANPLACEWNGFSCHDDATSIIITFMKQALIWTLFIGAYIFLRYNVYSYIGLWVLSLIILFYFITCSLDVIGNIGYYIGKVLYVAVVK
jgi:hypothetical protein